MTTKEPIKEFGEKIRKLRSLVESKSESIADELSSLLNEIKNGGESCLEYDDIKLFVTLLRWSNNVVVARTADILANLAKKENFREKCLNTEIVSSLCDVVKFSIIKEDCHIEVLTNSCRALGNLCYENAPHREYIVENGGIKMLMDVIRFSVTLKEDNDINAELRSASVGLFINFMVGQEQFYSTVLEDGIIDLLTDVLNAGTKGQYGENAGVHTLMVFEAIAELLASEKQTILNENLCKALAKSLKESSPGELSELCIELIHSQAQYPTAATNLSKSGLIEVLMDLLELHEDMSKNSDLQNIFKMACDCIIIVLNDDSAMKFLYDGGKGPVFRKLVKWISHSNKDLQVTGVLAIGNFARTDEHCIEMINQKIEKSLLQLLKLHNTENGNTDYQEALLSALRNLAIPTQNKQILVKDGLVNILYDLLSLTSYPIIFKLLGTLRMLVDGQEKVATEMGLKRDLIQKLVEWSVNDCHTGVQNEAQRLIAWIIKNSKNEDVMILMIECKTLPCLVDMILSDHTLMQNEALLALCLLTTIRLKDAEQSLLASEIGSKISKFFNGHPEKEVFENILTFVNQLCNSENLKAHMKKYEVSTGLKNCFKSSDVFKPLKDKVDRLVQKLDST